MSVLQSYAHCVEKGAENQRVTLSEFLHNYPFRLPLRLGYWRECDAGKTYATVERDGHHEPYRIRSEGFARWLRGEAMLASGESLSSYILEEVLGELRFVQAVASLANVQSRESAVVRWL